MTRPTDVDPDTGHIVDTLDSIHRATGRGRGRVFEDWMALATAAFARDDARYTDVLDAYPAAGTDDPDDAIRRGCAEDFSEALGALVAATADQDRPVLGDIYERVGRQSDALGQHFTPWNVSYAIAELTLVTDDLEDATPADPLTVGDPACGSGRLLVATAKAVHERAPETPLVVAGTDKDRTCARMTVVNLVIARVRGRVEHGNSLTDEVWRRWHVRPSTPGPAVVVDDDPETTITYDAVQDEPSDEAAREDTPDSDQESPDLVVDGEQANLDIWADDD